MKFIDMFCGIGTIRMGMEQAGHECVYSVEWDKHKRRIYSVIFGNEPESADIMAVRADELPKSDIWCFGAPCQDFSIAGKREGLEGDRSSLVREVCRLVRETKEEHRPEWLFYENVKGMFSSNKGIDYFQILCEMDELGYDIEWQLLNSKDYGVPQNRERVFTLGHLRSRGRREVFPIRASSEPIDIKIIGSTKGEECTRHGQRDAVYSTDGIMGYLTATDYKQPKQIMVKEPAILRPVRTEYGKNIRKAYESGEVKESRHNMTKLEPRTDGISNTITTVQKDNYLFIREATKQGYAEATEGDSINLAMPNSKTRRGRVGKGVANTLDTSCAQGTLEDGRIRRLTPKECWRLQGIPDYITEKVQTAGISDTQMYKGAGDATTVNVIYEIAKRL